MDRELQRLARKHLCWYSRYADDLTFSTNQPAFPAALARVIERGQLELGGELLSVFDANGFSLNVSKSRIQTRYDRQVVTGVKVNERPNVDRRFIRKIRSMMHAWDKYGPALAQEDFGRWYSKDRFPGADPRFQDVLRGRIAYLAMIRGPSDSMVRRFMDQYDNLKAGRDREFGIDYVPEPYHPPQASDSIRHKLLTVMFTDIVGSTAQAAIIGDEAWRGIREKHDRIIRSEVGRRWGRVIKWIGDSALVTFDSPSHAVECAKRIVRQVKSDLGIDVRIGLHSGEIEVEDQDIAGMAVNIAARVEAKAEASEILVSSTVKDLLMGSVIQFTDRGDHELKNVPGIWRLHAVEPEPES
jgi:class 3 adenylate cyclase